MDYNLTKIKSRVDAVIDGATDAELEALLDEAAEECGDGLFVNFLPTWKAEAPRIHLVPATPLERFEMRSESSSFLF